MARRKQILNPDNPIHVSSRCINREWFSLPLPIVWPLCEDYLWLTQKIFHLRIHSFVLMRNHYHLIVTAPENNLGTAMQYFNREFSRNMLKSADRINLTFGGRYFRSEITSYQHYMNVYKYVYRNPVHAGVCDLAEKYPYSTLGGLMGNHKLFIPIERDTLLFESEGFDRTIRWINTAPHEQDYLDMKIALKKATLKLPRDRGSKSHRLNTERY